MAQSGSFSPLFLVFCSSWIYHHCSILAAAVPQFLFTGLSVRGLVTTFMEKVMESLKPEEVIRMRILSSCGYKRSCKESACMFFKDTRSYFSHFSSLGLLWWTHASLSLVESSIYQTWSSSLWTDHYNSWSAHSPCCHASMEPRAVLYLWWEGESTTKPSPDVTL